ncbi:hypothetical protein N7476_000345 [Penicillium atrosanguineum]|uniref:Uncharacterized protein n=1 Tax=Penicillium atrosanguineum TaxID=1132637 RepID=A0A9W9QGH5_9EURO|nr:hypothetical protein N7476_000345 [Penicillium atrosanguineum]
MMGLPMANYGITLLKDPSAKIKEIFRLVERSLREDDNSEIKTSDDKDLKEWMSYDEIELDFGVLWGRTCIPARKLKSWIWPDETWKDFHYQFVSNLLVRVSETAI